MKKNQNQKARKKRRKTLRLRSYRSNRVMVNLTNESFALLEQLAKRTGHSLSQCVENALCVHERDEQRELTAKIAREKGNAILRAVGLLKDEVSKQFGASEEPAPAEPEREAQVRAPEPLE